jgi:hypothetical protein
VAIILARGQRYEVANYDNVSIPTNVDVADGTRTQFGAFYAALFDRVVEKHPRAVVTEYSWDASSCDPCPIPALDEQALATLGADVLPETTDLDPRATGSQGFVITRLHARYTRDALGDDLHFRPAPPIVGGRESMGEDGRLEQGARADSMNNFQARYVIRHRWAGAVTCAKPQFGVWGGPPDGHGAGPVPALDLAFAPRDADLGALVKSALPEGITLSRGEPVAPPRIPPSGGCAGCAMGRRGNDLAAAWGCVAVLAATVWRAARRRRR